MATTTLNSMCTSIRHSLSIKAIASSQSQPSVLPSSQTTVLSHPRDFSTPTSIAHRLTSFSIHFHHVALPHYSLPLRPIPLRPRSRTVLLHSLSRLRNQQPLWRAILTDQRLLGHHKLHHNRNYRARHHLLHSGILYIDNAALHRAWRAWLPAQVPAAVSQQNHARADPLVQLFRRRRRRLGAGLLPPVPSTEDFVLACRLLVAALLGWP